MSNKEKKAPLSIITLGHPTLRKKAQELSVEEIKSKVVQQFIEDIQETLGNEKHGAALAANQVDKLWQIIVIELENMSVKVLINPEVVKFSEKRDLAFEGCLSIPGYWGQVVRSEKIVVEAFNRKGEKIKIKASGFNARVIQHEIDHLSGILFIERMEDWTTLITDEELARRAEEQKKKEQEENE